MSDFNDKLLEELYALVTPNKVELFDRIAANRTNHLTVVLENIYQEHNASAVLRSCDCFGINKLHIVEKDNHYKVQRDIALGAGQWVNMHNYKQAKNPTATCLNQLKKDGYKIIATTPHTNNVTIDKLDISKPMALVFGTELEGISEEAKQLADAFVKIPMQGFTESFNISVAAAICMHVLRQKMENATELNWKLSHEEQVALKLQWCEKVIPKGYMVVPEVRKRLLLES